MRNSFFSFKYVFHAQWNSEILIRGRSAGSDPQRNVAFHLLENEFENVELTHGTRLGMDGKALG